MNEEIYGSVWIINNEEYIFISNKVSSHVNDHNTLYFYNPRTKELDCYTKNKNYD